MRTLIAGGSVLDGTGADAIPADVLIDADRIVRMAPTGTIDAWGAAVLDAAGKVVAPGFIDVHAHDDLAVFEHPGLEFKLSQGVTTEIVGNCGLGAAPLTPEVRDGLVGNTGFLSSVLGPCRDAPWTGFGEYVVAVRDAAVALNVGVLAPHGVIRTVVCGSQERAAKSDQVAAMRALVADAMEAGALGMSTGLAYSLGRAADTDELVSLASVVAEAGGVYASHVRNESDTVGGAVEEALTIGERAGCRVHVSHLKALGRANWGKVGGLLVRIAAAGATCDVYPYTAASTFLRDAMRAGGTVTPIEPGDISIASATGVPGVVGRTLEEIAAEWHMTPGEAADRLLERAPSGVSVVYFGMSADDVSLVIRDARSVFGSDGLPTLEGAPHPRLFGTFPRVIRRHVLDGGDLGLPEAVRKATSMAADIFGLHERGRLQEGAFADVVVFDPTRVRDEATFTDPKRYASGIDAVLVNGTLAWKDGAATGGRTGRLLTRTG